MRLTDQDFIGKKFGMLVAIRLFRDGVVPKVECRCDCGTVKVVNAYDINTGGVKSCGCLRRAAFNKTFTTHGHAKGTRTKEYLAWRGMIARCAGRGKHAAKYYVEKGIKICPDWRDFTAFLADVGPAPSNRHSLDRIDNSLGYQPGNVRWATHEQQARNRDNSVYVNIDGQRMLLVAAAEKYSINAMTVRNRLAQGWAEEAAIKTPQRTASRPLERRS